MTFDKQDKLAALRKKTLIRDDQRDPDGRVYINQETGEIFHSVTRVLGTTSPPEQQKALAKWLQRPGAYEDRDAAAKRGTGAHSHMEFVLKLSSRLARATANKKGLWKAGEDGLYRCPTKITQWAMEKAIAGAPRVPWASSGYARGLRGWMLDHITAIHSVEFSGWHPLHSSMDGALHNYKAQTGAYSLILKHMTGIQAIGGAVVVARRSGEPVTTLLNTEELIEQEGFFLERIERHYDQLAADNALKYES